MKKRRFYCQTCEWDFEFEVFEPGEAEKRRLPSRPISCPQCGGSVKPV